MSNEFMEIAKRLLTVIRGETGSTIDLVKATSVVAGYLQGTAGVDAKWATQAISAGRAASSKGLSMDVALAALGDPPGPAKQMVPDVVSGKIGLRFLDALFDTIPDDELVGLTAAQMVDALALATTHLLRSLDIPLLLFVSRLGVAMIMADQRIREIDAATPEDGNVLN